jgi:protein-S-isoprenylcysteine O-methyltransferase Ste14
VRWESGQIGTRSDLAAKRIAMRPELPALIWRLLDEEKFLARNLSGYVEYQEKVRYRLIPPVW